MGESRAAQVAGRRRAALVRLYELPLLLGLIAMWMLLWQDFSWLSALSGAVIAALLMRIFYLPPVHLAGRINLWWSLRFIGYFLWNLQLASWQVAWLAIRRSAPPKSAIIAVRLHTQSDFILTLVAITISLIPGSLVAEVDRFESKLFLHVLNTPDGRAVRAMRREVQKIERLLILSCGSRDEMRVVR